VSRDNRFKRAGKHVGEIFRRDAPQLVWTKVAASDHTTEVLEPNAGYFRVWLSDMYLARSRDWFTNRYPAVHASVSLRFGEHEQATFSTLSRPAPDMLGPGVFNNFALTPLLPYRGGTVELTVGLTVLKGASLLVAGLDVLGDFSGLIGPPLSQTLGVATKVTSGVTKLIDAVGDGVVLSLANTFAAAGGTGANVLAPGWWAIVRAPQERISPASLRVDNNRLHTFDGEGLHPLAGYDHMLLRIEGRRERDDWRFANIEALINKAHRAYFGGQEREFLVYRNAALAEVFSTPDLTPVDHQRVANAIAAELDAVRDLPLAMTGQPRPLAQIIAEHAPSADEILRGPPITLGQLV
jgi:hypothetical protein